MVGDIKRQSSVWKWFISLVVLAVVLWGIWVLFFSYEICDTWECFNENLEGCDRAMFIGGDDMIFEYIIKGSDDGECEVGVRLLQGELNNQDSIKLEMHKMTCMVPEGVVILPESNIAKCSGLLKEGLQDLVIKKLHTYLVQNLGKLNLEIADLSEFN